MGEIIEVNGAHFDVVIERGRAWKGGTVYPVCKWWSGDKTGFSYESKTEGGRTYDEINPDVRRMFKFTIVWRGVWDERIYFDGDDEYRGYELEQIYHVWQVVREKVKDMVRKENPYAE